MYALINTMGQTSDTIGAIISRHRTIEAAERADAKLQRAVRAANGSNSYLPTTIVRLTCRPVGRFIAHHEWTQAHG